MSSLHIGMVMVLFSCRFRRISLDEGADVRAVSFSKLPVQGLFPKN